MRYILAIVLLGMTFLASSVRAQSTNYSITWFTIAGGGGTSSGGSYSVSGTVGQHSTSTMSGGNYSLTGGFWSIIAAVQTPGAPVLTITQAGAQAIISWLASSTDFVLEKSPSLTTGSWTPTSVTLTTNSGVISATVPAASGYQFYRLQSQ
jgi:hypothetical protein